MLLLMFVVAWAFLIPAALSGVPLIPFPLPGAILSRAARASGAGHVGRWRRPGSPQALRPGIPLAYPPGLVPACTSRDTGRVTAVDRRGLRRRGSALAVPHPSVIEAYLSALTILPIVSLWEEMAWMG